MFNKKLNTVIIDDSRLQILINRRLVFKHKSLELISDFSDPKLGLEFVNNSPIDLLILDMDMPQMNGIEVLKQLKSNCKVLVYSDDCSYKEKVLTNGTNLFLCKTSPMKDFLDTIDLFVFEKSKRSRIAV